MPYLLFLKKQQNLKLSSVAKYRWRFIKGLTLFVLSLADAYPEDIVLYENLKGNEMKTDL